MDENFDIATVLKSSSTFKTEFKISDINQNEESKRYSVELPTKKDLKEVEKQFGFLFDSTSPIFLSKSNGIISRGIKSVPTGLEGRPVLLVGNHQLYGTFNFFKNKY